MSVTFSIGERVADDFDPSPLRRVRRAHDPTRSECRIALRPLLSEGARPRVGIGDEHHVLHRSPRRSRPRPARAVDEPLELQRGGPSRLGRRVDRRSFTARCPPVSSALGAAVVWTEARNIDPGLPDEHARRSTSSAVPRATSELAPKSSVALRSTPATMSSRGGEDRRDAGVLNAAPTMLHFARSPGRRSSTRAPYLLSGMRAQSGSRPPKAPRESGGEAKRRALTPSSLHPAGYLLRRSA